MNRTNPTFTHLPSDRGIGHPHGFTLIELLVVISIIALLIGILLPALSAARQRAQATLCLGHTRQLAMASLMYAQERHMFVGWKMGVDRKQLLYPYLNQGQDNSDVEGNQVWNCPSNRFPLEAAGYGFNSNLNWTRLEAIRTPSETVNVTDAGINDFDEHTKPTLATHSFPPSAISTASIGRPNPRHPSLTVNVAYVDGHAASTPMTEPFYPDVPGQWKGNGITDPNHADYKDQLWDLR